MSPVASGTRRELVTLESPDVVGLDGHGGYTTSWAPLSPPTAFAAIAPATEVQQERAVGGTVVASATHVLHVPYHPQVSVQTRITLNGRTLQVLSRRDPDERHVELVLVCTEVLGTIPVPPVAVAAALTARAGVMVLTSATLKLPPPVLSYADQVRASGATHYWRLGEPAGTIAGDVIGYAHGTISGGVTLNQPGALSDGDKAMSFNGTTGKVVTAASVPLPLACTIEAWVKIDAAVTTAHVPIFSTRDAGTGDTVYVGSFYDGITLLGSPVVFSGAGSANCPVIIRDGQWHHCVFVFAPSDVSIYVDGQLRTHNGSVPRTTASQGPARIGNDATLWAIGSLDEVAIYPVALTAAQIAAHYAAGMAA